MLGFAVSVLAVSGRGQAHAEQQQRAGRVVFSACAVPFSRQNTNFLEIGTYTNEPQASEWVRGRRGQIGRFSLNRWTSTITEPAESDCARNVFHGNASKIFPKIIKSLKFSGFRGFEECSAVEDVSGTVGEAVWLWC